MRTIFAVVLIPALIIGLMPYKLHASENKPVPKIESGLEDILTGYVETPDSINETNSKGTKAYPDCTDKTKDGVGRAIVKVVGGAWKLLTFWYPED